MSNITTKIEDGININTIVGKISAYEIFKFIESNLDEWKEMPILYNISDAQFEDFSSGNMDKFIDSIKPLFKKRGIGKTALVSYKNSNFGILRMFEIMVEKNMLNNRYASFRSIDEAKKWLLY